MDELYEKFGKDGYARADIKPNKSSYETEERRKAAKIAKNDTYSIIEDTMI